MDILVESKNGKNFWLPSMQFFEKIVPVRQTKFVQFVHKTQTRNAEIILGGFNVRFSEY